MTTIEEAEAKAAEAENRAAAAEAALAAAELAAKNPKPDGSLGSRGGAKSDFSTADKAAVTAELAKYGIKTRGGLR